MIKRLIALGAVAVLARGLPVAYVHEDLPVKYGIVMGCTSEGHHVQVRYGSDLGVTNTNPYNLILLVPQR